VVVTWSSCTALGFRLGQALDVGVVGLDDAPWTLAQVLGLPTADLLASGVDEIRADLVARIVIFRDRGGGYNRHVAPGLRLT